MLESVLGFFSNFEVQELGIGFLIFFKFFIKRYDSISDEILDIILKKLFSFVGFYNDQIIEIFSR